MIYLEISALKNIRIGSTLEIMKRQMNITVVQKRLRALKGTRSWTEVAEAIHRHSGRKIGIAYLSHIMLGRRRAPEFVLRYLGIEERYVEVGNAR